MSGLECAYSFRDLFQAAFGREAKPEEMDEFSHLTQEEKNQKVKEWAKLADWNTLDKVGADGQTYTAFYPKWGRRL